LYLLSITEVCLQDKGRFVKKKSLLAGKFCAFKWGQEKFLLKTKSFGGKRVLREKKAVLLDGVWF